MQEDRTDTKMTDEARRMEAAANLEKRRQQMGKRPRNKRRRKYRVTNLKRFVLFGSILVVILLLVVACSVNAIRTSREANNAAASEEKDSGKKKDGSIVMGLKGPEVQFVLEGEKYIENGAFAIDTRTGALQESDISIKGKVDTARPGDYKIEYSAKSDGLKAKTERTVRVLTEEEYGQKAGNVPVLMYHWVYSADDVPEALDGNWILDTDLDEQMAFLSENEFYFPGWKELRAWIDGEISIPAKCAIVTFDDGTYAFLKHGRPVLEKYRIPATSFMIGKKNDAAKKIRSYASPYIDFESHTNAMHIKNEETGRGIATVMSKEDISKDLAKAAKLVGSNDAMAYPYGDYTDDMIDAVREQGILCAFTIEYDRVRQGMDPMRLPRVRVLGTESFQDWKNSVY